MKKAFKKTRRALSKTLILRKGKTTTATKANTRHVDVQAYTSIENDADVVDINASTNETKDEHTSQLFKPDLVEEICGFRETYCRCNPVKDYSPIEIFQPVEVDIVNDLLVGPDKIDQETVTWLDQTDQNFFDHASDKSIFNIIEKPNSEAAILVIESNSVDKQTENDDSISSKQQEPVITGSELEPVTKEPFSSPYDEETVGQEGHCQLSTNYEEDKSHEEHHVPRQIQKITSNDVPSSISYKRSNRPRKIKSQLSTNYEEDKSHGEHQAPKKRPKITSNNVPSSLYKRSKSPRKIKSLICWKLLLRCCY